MEAWVHTDVVLSELWKWKLKSHFLKKREELLKHPHCLLGMKLNLTSVIMRSVLSIKEFKRTARYIYEKLQRLFFGRRANKHIIKDRAAWHTKIFCLLLDPIDIYVK